MNTAEAIRRGKARQKRFHHAKLAMGEGRWRIHNLRKSITRLERRLRNSMAYVAEPRDRNRAHWATLAAEIEDRKATLASLERGEAIPPPVVPRKGFRTEGKRGCLDVD